MTILCKKQKFSADRFVFEAGKTIPIEIGYETLGTLNPIKDNAILIVHYFSATSHCAGKYNDADEQSGFWDALVGPGKAVDTNRYFVVCSDNLCNCGAYDPMVVTTGPSSIDPHTGKAYGLSFPVPSVLDIVNAQKLLLECLGITHLKAVIGPSFGAMAAFQWAVAYPEMMDCIIPVTGSPIHPVYGSLSPLQHGIRAAMLDPKWNDGNYYDNKEKPTESLHLAMQMMHVAAFQPGYFEKAYPRERGEHCVSCSGIYEVTAFEKKLYSEIALKLPSIDLNHWIYTCRMCMNYDITRTFGGNLDETLKQIKAKVLAIPCKQDLLHPWEYVKSFVNRINMLGGTAELYPIESDYGHMAGILQTHLFEDQIKDFLHQAALGVCHVS